MLPQKFTVTVAGTPAANSTNTLIYLFNPSVFAPVTAATGQDTDNIAYTWSDKNQGLTIERILYTARFAIGAILYGFSVSLTINGAGDVQGLNTLQPTIGDWDAYGNFIVQENFVTSSNETRKDQFLYLHVTRCAHNMGGTKQIRFTLPMNGTTSADTAAWVFYLTPNFEL